jgi:FkbM family methyltransferase
MPRINAAIRVLNTILTENSGADRFLFLFFGLLWRMRRRIGKPFITELGNGARLKVHASSAYSGIFYLRWIERKDVLFIRDHSYLAPTFVDVGANVGLFSAMLFDRFATFYMIEPAPSSFQALCEVRELNPHVASTVLQVAVSDRPGTVMFLDEGDFSTGSRVVDAPTSGTAVRQLHADTLDNLLRELTGDIVLKVDVEGLEERVFYGARGLFQSGRVKLVVFERLGRTNLDRIHEFFDRMGYAVFYVDEKGGISIDKEVLAVPLVNLFACPRPVLRDLRLGRRDQ